MKRVPKIDTSIAQEKAKKSFQEARGLLKEFREFITKGNVVDMAVGVIIGAAFGKIVTSLVNDILMPLIGLLFGSGQFTDLSFTLREATETDAALVFRYGSFIQNIVDFLLVSLCIFLMIKMMNGLRRKMFSAQRQKEEEEKAKKEAEEKAEKEAKAQREEEQRQMLLVLQEIRDELKNKG